MTKKSIEQLLKAVDDFSRLRGLTRREIAKKMDIPYDSFRKWFQKGEGRKPSLAHAEKMESFLESQQETEAHWRELWGKILKWWETQHRYSSVNELADEIGWDVFNLGSSFQNKEMPPKLVIEKIAETVGIEIPASDFLSKEAHKKAEKAKHLLLFLEEELRWFRDSSKEARDIFRRKLDPGDVGYVSSLLTMLGSEDKFRRWLTFTTNRFNFFRNRRGQK